MAKVVILKRVSLGFLGERYAESYVNVRSISMRERADLIKQLDNIKDETKSFEFIKNLVEERFVDGEFKDGDMKAEALTVEDLMDFPGEVYLEILQQLQGRPDPKP